MERRAYTRARGGQREASSQRPLSRLVTETETQHALLSTCRFWKMLRHASAHLIMLGSPSLLVQKRSCKRMTLVATRDGHRKASGSRSVTSWAGALRPKFSSASSSLVKAGLCAGVGASVRLGAAFSAARERVRQTGRTRRGSWESRLGRARFGRVLHSRVPSYLQRRSVPPVSPKPCREDRQA